MKYKWVGRGYSDDIGWLEGARLPDGSVPDESLQCMVWYEFKINGEVVGRVMMDWDGGWQCLIESDTHEISAGGLLYDFRGEDPLEE